jgi:hypothetical protein
VIVPTIGGVGVVGWAFITILADDAEVHPAALVTVNEYELAVRPDTVVLIPVPEVVVPPGDLVKVHVPVAGRPFKTMLPVAIEHVGCVIIPAVGGVGEPGATLINTLADATEIHASAFVTVNV